IRDLIVTGVQTCALPIYHITGWIPRQENAGLCTTLRKNGSFLETNSRVSSPWVGQHTDILFSRVGFRRWTLVKPESVRAIFKKRSEERRVGKECRCRRGT